MVEKKFANCILNPEIIELQNVQAFQFKGKDARGYDFSVFISAIEPGSGIPEIPQKMEADRVAVYFGGDPANIGEIGTEIEITMGEKPETQKIDSAAVVYIPKGQPYHHSVLRKPEKRSWLYSLTLPPKYIHPE